MISFLSGKPIVGKDQITLLVNGVGYAVDASPLTLQFCQQKEMVELFISTHVTQDAITLFGFGSAGEKQLFELLVTVSGIGPRTALLITDRGQQTVLSAIQQADVSFFSKIPRVGKKTAQKIIIELKSKVGGLAELDLQPLNANQRTISDALVSLGFAETDIEHVVKKLDLDKMSIQAAVQQALKQLGNSHN